MSAALLAPSVTVRRATPEDAQQIHVLTLAAYAEYAGTRASSSVTRETAEALQAALESHEVEAAIVEQDGKMIGSVRYRRDGNALYFFRLGVLPEARGLGIARQLLTFLEQEARRRGMEALRCVVRSSVPRNVRLYESSGFERIGYQRVQRGDVTLHLLTMEKILTRNDDPVFSGVSSGAWKEESKGSGW